MSSADLVKSETNCNDLFLKIKIKCSSCKPLGVSQTDSDDKDCQPERRRMVRKIWRNLPEIMITNCTKIVCR